MHLSERAARTALTESKRAEGDFHMRIYDGYRELAARWPERFEVVDASGTIDEIFSDLTARLKKRGVL